MELTDVTLQYAPSPLQPDRIIAVSDGWIVATFASPYWAKRFAAGCAGAGLFVVKDKTSFELLPDHQTIDA